MAIDHKTKALVYYLSRFQGLSVREVARECNVSRATVWRISKMDMSSNGCKKTRRETRGRPRKLNKRQERKLRRSIQILR
jgi:transposase